MADYSMLTVEVRVLNLLQYGEDGNAIARIWVVLPQIRVDRRKVGVTA